MKKASDIPPAKKLDEKAIIEVQADGRIIHLVASKITRGKGANKGHLSMDGVCSTEPPLLENCYVYFRGAAYSSNFSYLKKLKTGWQTTLKTIIRTPEFWK